jgi:hypothetical protein
MEGAFILTNGGDIQPGVDSMFNYRRIKAKHLHIGPDKNVSVFLKESFVSNDLFRGACGTYGDLFYNVWFNGNVNFDSGGDIGHVPLFKIMGGRDRIFEPVNVPWGNKNFGFDCAQGGLGRRVKGLV